LYRQRNLLLELIYGALVSLREYFGSYIQTCYKFTACCFSHLRTLINHQNPLLSSPSQPLTLSSSPLSLFLSPTGAARRSGLERRARHRQRARRRRRERWRRRRLQLRLGRPASEGRGAADPSAVEPAAGDDDDGCGDAGCGELGRRHGLGRSSCNLPPKTKSKWFFGYVASTCQSKSAKLLKQNPLLSSSLSLSLFPPLPSLSLSPTGAARRGGLERRARHRQRLRPPIRDGGGHGDDDGSGGAGDGSICRGSGRYDDDDGSGGGGGGCSCG